MEQLGDVNCADQWRCRTCQHAVLTRCHWCQVMIVARQDGNIEVDALGELERFQLEVQIGQDKKFHDGARWSAPDAACASAM